MKIARRQLRRIIKEAQWGNFTGGAAPLDEPPLDSGPMSPEDQQRVFDMLVDSGSEPSELKATGKYPDVDSLSSEVARRYFKRKYDWVQETRDYEMKITKRQLRRIIREAIDPRELEEPLGGWAGNALKNDPDYKHHTDNEPFKIPYKNYGYEGRKIMDRDRAWLEFVPKGAPSMTREDRFRAVTLLDSDDLEIGLAMATTHAPKFDRRHLENYDVYSVYATTTG